MPKRRVILYGRSVILGTVGVSLERYPDLEVVHLPSPLPAIQELALIKPDVVLFDSATMGPDALFSLLKTCPNLHIIGVNAESDQIELWSREQGSALSIGDLVKVITRDDRAC